MALTYENDISGVEEHQSTTWRFEFPECDKIFNVLKNLEEHLKCKKHLEMVSGKNIQAMLPMKEDIQIEATNKVQPKIQKVMDWQFENGIRGDGKNHQNNLMFENIYGDKSTIF